MRTSSISSISRRLLDCLLVIVLGSTCAVGQTIKGVEMFWDEDPGIGKGLALGISSSQASLDTVLSLPVEGLSLGGHVLGVRALSDSGAWSLTHRRVFFIQKAQQWSPLQVEWFFDEDPGIGKSILQKSIHSPLAGLDSLLLLELGDVAIGAHQLGVRVRQADGRWGHTHFRTLSLHPPTAEIVNLEYFWNEDPGIGNGTFLAVTPIPSIDVTETVNGAGRDLSLDTLFFRAYDSNGAISHTHAAGQFASTDSLDLRIYPNPISTGEVWIEGYVGTNQPLEISLVTMLGVRLKQESTLPTETSFLYSLDVSDLVSGFYVMTVRQGFATFIQRLIVAGK